jgi:hypothetical protein
MQVHAFPDGSFVAHKVNLPNSACKFSIWYDSENLPFDAERIDVAGRSYRLTRLQWKYVCRHNPFLFV